MGREVLATDRAPAAVGPYSQACRHSSGRTVYLSGQIPLDPETGQLVAGSVVEQAERCMENLGAVLQAGGLEWDDVVRCTIYMTDLGNFTAVNDVYGRFFTDPPPARACVQVAALPRGAQVEIDAVAERG